MKTQLKKWLQQSPAAKKAVLRFLMPKGQARPRLIVKMLINPFFHKKGRGSKICPSTRMDVFPFNRFDLGKGATVEDFATINNGMGDVFIGAHSRVGIGSVIIGPVSIGKQVIIAQHVVLSGLNHTYSDIRVPIKDQPCTAAPIVVEDEVWIGAHALITPGVMIGRHSVVAGGSVVTKDVPPNTVVAGNPAKIIRQYNALSESWEKITAHV